MFKKKCEHDWHIIEMVMESDIVGAIMEKLKQPEIGWRGGYIYYKKICLLCGEKSNEIPEAYDRILADETRKIKAQQSFPEDSWEEIKSRPIAVAG